MFAARSRYYVVVPRFNSFQVRVLPRVYTRFHSTSVPVVQDVPPGSTTPHSIATRPQSRNLVLCIDGTTNHYSIDKNTNVVHLYSMLQDNEQQLVHYQAGLGAYMPPKFVPSSVARLLDSASAWSLEDHVLESYRFLMDTYREGDKIFLFGFSRGAYVARVLAAMLFRVGLLRKGHKAQVSFAYKIYTESHKEFQARNKDPTAADGWHSANFSRLFCRKVAIEFLGAWDTVSSVGSLVPTYLPNTASNPCVKHVRHAVALDEKRAKFKANLWTKPKIKQRGSNRSVEEVYFAGSHANVGGGQDGYSAASALSRISLRWMVREAMATTPLLWNEKRVQRFKVRKPTTPEELREYAMLERADALSPSYDSLDRRHSTLSWFLWSLMEWIPFKTYREVDGTMKPMYWPNRFRARQIRAPTAQHPTKIHSSVKTRLEHYQDLAGQPYRNAAKWGSDPTLVEFVDEWALPEKGEP